MNRISINVEGQVKPTAVDHPMLKVLLMECVDETQGAQGSLVVRPVDEVSWVICFVLLCCDWSVAPRDESSSQSFGAPKPLKSVRITLTIRLPECWQSSRFLLFASTVPCVWDLGPVLFGCHIVIFVQSPSVSGNFSQQGFA